MTTQPTTAPATALVPTRTFLPLADSPLTARTEAIREADANLAVRLAAQADPAPALIRSLLAITHQPTAERVAGALAAREDLSAGALTVLVALRPDLKAPAARLRAVLFPDAPPQACHTFARTVAALVHWPETLDPAYLAGPKFAAAATAADPAALGEVLADVLAAETLTGPADAALGRLLDARAAAGVPAADIDQQGAAARERTRTARIGAELAARRTDTITGIAEHTGGRTLAAELWFDALTTAADTPESAGQALALALLAPQTLAADGPFADPATPWPGARARWQQITAATRAAETDDGRWHRAWEKAATTADGSLWDPAQRGLVAGYELLADHVGALDATDVTPTPDECWAADPAGRTLLHTVAEHLTGHHRAGPLPLFDDALLISFIQGLAKNRRDKIPGALHIHGLIAALKAARSRHHLLTQATEPQLGIVVPMRAEAQRLTAAGGRDPLTTKAAQLGWLLAARPGAHAHLLLVDEDPDGASAQAARQITTDNPQLTVTVATRHDPASAKAGAVLWGLEQLREAGCTTIGYTDLDLTYPLEQIGLHLAALAHPGTAAVTGSRRLPDSHGYYPPAGPGPATVLYQQAVTELLGLKVTDPQAGFKLFTAAAIAAATPLVADRGLSFDTEVLAALQSGGHTVAEVGIAALHHWVDGRQGCPRDYDQMLTTVTEQARRHRPGTRPTPVLDRILAAGSLAQAAARPAPVDVALIPAPR